MSFEKVHAVLSSKSSKAVVLSLFDLKVPQYKVLPVVFLFSCLFFINRNWECWYMNQPQLICDSWINFKKLYAIAEKKKKSIYI